MNVLYLKIIALISMIIDHYGAIFEDNIDMYRIIGRIAFPIYCFLLVEGFYHTKDVKKYALRLFIFALLSEIPFDLAFFGKLEFTHQNVFFTLLIGLIAIYNLHKYEEKSNFIKTAIVFIAFVASVTLNVDYHIIGIIYILSFYYTKNYSILQRLGIIAILMFITNLLLSSILQQFSLMSLIILYFYNSELGPSNKIQQIFFYAAYPVHLFILYLIKILIF